MLRSFHSSQDAHDDHLRSLIGQRNQRADVHTRFSATSEDEDSPSVYSRAFFSPLQPGNGDRPSYHAEHPYASPVSPSLSRAPYGTPRPHDGATSMLDLDDDPRSSFAPSEAYDDDEKLYDDDEDTESTSRISYLGPKMRFHSRAPWEMEDSPLQEEEEPEENPRHLRSGFGPGRPDQKRTSDTSSPRPSFMSRKSGESSRSHVPPKRSFETINSQVSHPRGALYALAQESLSATSLGRAPPPQKETLRTKFSLGRLRSESAVAAASLPPSPNISPGQSRPHNLFQSHQANSDQPAHSFDSSQHTPLATPYPLPNDPAPPANVHPYANPELVVSYTTPAPAAAHPVSNFPLQHNDSSVTVTESSTVDSLAGSGRSTLASDSSANSLLPAKPRVVSVHLKNISSPIAVMGPDRPDLPSSAGAGLPGWADRGPAPAFSLISLEEARAQRMRNSTTNDISRVSSASSTAGSSAPPPDVDSAKGSQSADNTPFGTFTSRARGRSISAGANKAKTALQTIVGQPKPERRESEPALFGQQQNASAPPKTLKHKKSGFMRLFKGQEKEKEEREQLPPVPSFPDARTYASPTQRSAPTSHRVPVPSLSPSLFEAVNTSSLDTLDTDTSTHTPESAQSPRRVAPYLSINTNYSAPAAMPRPSPSTNTTDRSALARTMPPSAFERPWVDEAQPQSAPAHVTQFPALKLRPVSTLFSAHFADHIVPGTSEPRSSAETTLDTPRSSSPNTLVSPITPGMRTSNDTPGVVTIVDDQQNVLKSSHPDPAHKALQQKVWELEGQIRTLKAELESVKKPNSGEYCQACGRGKESGCSPTHVSVINRPRARTGNTSRFTNALP